MTQPLDPETERKLEYFELALQSAARTVEAHDTPTIAGAVREAAAHMRKLAQEVAERGINIDTLIRSRDTAQRELSDLRRQYDTLREKLQKDAAETNAELERLREAVRWFAASEDVNASLTHWVSGNSECDNEEPLQPDPAAALIKLHERDKP